MDWTQYSISFPVLKNSLPSQYKVRKVSLVSFTKCDVCAMIVHFHSTNKNCRNPNNHLSLFLQHVLLLNLIGYLPQLAVLIIDGVHFSAVFWL